MKDMVLFELGSGVTVSAFGLSLCGTALGAWHAGRAAGVPGRALLLALLAAGLGLAFDRLIGGEGTLGALAAFGGVLYLAESGRAVWPAVTFASGLLLTAGVFGAIYGEPWPSGLAYGRGSLARAAHEVAGLIDPASSHSLPTLPVAIFAAVATALSAAVTRLSGWRASAGVLSLAAICAGVTWFRADGFGGGALATLTLLCVGVVELWRARLESAPLKSD